MKLEMTLPERPGLLHAVPLLNIFSLLLLFFLLGPALLLQSGVTVDLPPSKFQMERYQNSIVVSVGPGEPFARIHLGRDSVTLQQLAERLTSLRETGVAAKTIVLLQTDKSTPVDVERQIAELVLDKGFRLAVVGKNTVDASIPFVKPAEK